MTRDPHYTASLWLTALLMLFGHGAGAATQPGIPTIASEYPWQRLPLACEKMDSAGCKVADWPNFDTSVYRIRMMFETEEFAGLERAFREIAADNRKFPSGKSLMSAAYLGMRQAIPSSGEGKRPGEIIGRWRTKYPKSVWLPFAAARFEYSMAWSARSERAASQIGEGAWISFEEHLEKARGILESAPLALKDQSLWYNLMLAIVLDLKGMTIEAGDIYQRAVDRWPDHYEFYDLMISRLVPQWGGSWPTVDEYIEEVSEHRKGSEGRSLYARLYLNLTVDRDFPIKETNAQWHELKQGFDDLVARYPDPMFLNLYASHACLYKDADAYKKAMKLLNPKTLSEAGWLATTSTRNCPR